MSPLLIGARLPRVIESIVRLPAQQFCKQRAPCNHGMLRYSREIKGRFGKSFSFTGVCFFREGKIRFGALLRGRSSRTMTEPPLDVIDDDFLEIGRDRRVAQGHGFLALEYG